eukprot:CAMPEP_0168395654 /NCGR_PEP_ID=MMETSP0228-20121227/20156_1 /TAXON_ID=133427 /ORGANISM="Protoceratium reticulatum, Strain CCCM 535 (=CCMP 1889)" /LENGTH=133 /DNA_ID=CAMNT_0008409095 /DNA_START=500 /DNA_END=901 /DNA_ORIENTATION=-
MCLQQLLEAQIHVSHHLGNGQVIVILTKRLLDLRRHVIQAPECQHRHKRQKARLQAASTREPCQKGCEERCAKQQHDNHLRVWERKWHLSNLAHILGINETARQLLEDPRKDRSGDWNNTRVVIIHDQPLYPL